MSVFKEIYNYREMLFSLVKRDLKGKYKASLLGFLWSFISPLLQLVVYTIVFSVILRSGIDKYYLFLFVALVPWLFFSTSISGGSGCIISQSSMVGKIYFPREILPISFVTSAFVNMLLSFIVVIAVLLLSEIKLNLIAFLYLPLIMLIEYVLAMGLTLIISATTVYFRDLEYIMGILIMAWQFMTPIMYSIDQVPQALQNIFMLNPMTPVIMAYRDILYYSKAPEMQTLLLSSCMAVLSLTLGFVIFGKLKKRFVEEL